MNHTVKYPVYRKYNNDLSWFRINSAESFDEIRKMGAQYLKSVHTVKILPERTMLHDLLFDYGEFAVEIDREEFEAIERLATG